MTVGDISLTITYMFEPPDGHYQGDPLTFHWNINNEKIRLTTNLLHRTLCIIPDIHRYHVSVNRPTTHHIGVCLNPPLPLHEMCTRVRQPIRELFQSQAYFDTLKWELGEYDVRPSAKFPLQESSASRLAEYKPLCQPSYTLPSTKVDLALKCGNWRVHCYHGYQILCWPCISIDVGVKAGDTLLV